MDISGKRPMARIVAVSLIALTFAGLFVPGTASTQPQPPSCPLDEDFSDSWLPSGWTQEQAGEWYQSSSSSAGGTSPEAVLSWYHVIYGYYAYLDSKPVDTTGSSSLTLEFKSFIDDYAGAYNCAVYTRADGGDSWTDVTPWSNPIYGNVGPDTYSVDISPDIGAATQVRFEFSGNDWNIDSWYVDDVKICRAGLALPDLVVSIMSVAFDEYGNFTVSYNVTNQGTAATPDSSVTGEYVDGVNVAARGCPPLAPGQNFSDTFSSVFCPVPCGGTFNVTVCADDWHYYQESDEGNNCDANTITRPCPDLVVSITSVVFDGSGNFTVSYNVTNVGTYPSPDGIVTAKYVDGSFEEPQGCPALNPGESYSGSFNPESCPVPCGGTFEVKVHADDDGDVTESHEDNNWGTNTVARPCPEIVDPKQDSLCLDVDGNGAADPGDILQYVAEIRNEGNATASGVTFSDTVDANTILMCAAPYAAIVSQGSITGCNSAPGGSLAADLGDIGPEGVATVTFYVRIGSGEFDRVANQGLVTGHNFADDPTDDPDTSELDDPTDTPISPPGPAPAPAVPAVNHWGIVAMITLFAGLLVWVVRRRQAASRLSD